MGTKPTKRAQTGTGIIEILTSDRTYIHLYRCCFFSLSAVATKRTTIRLCDIWNEERKNSTEEQVIIE